ncbi:hypothetical protein MKX01_030209 [Papaver californicum]|nr:hypothetical protein MKX01_030209 [Papaver californicum]
MCIDKRLLRPIIYLAVKFVLDLALSNVIGVNGEPDDGHCKLSTALAPRPHTVSILEFGAVGDGKTLNTIAFQNAIFYAKSFADKGGAQLYVPSGRWLTGSFNLTSHLTLFLEGGAFILGTQDLLHWGIVEPLPSYGRGVELPGGRYTSLIMGYNLTDVIITGNSSVSHKMLATINSAGDNGTIDGQGSVWWEWYNSHYLNYSRPHLVELVNSNDILVSNLTFLNSPAWSIHPVYCSNVRVQNITIHAPSDSPYTYGIVPDSSDCVCIENCTINVGYDAIVLKSGWDQYGIAYGRPTTNVQIRDVHLQASLGSGLAFGSEMSGGISNIPGSNSKTTKGRGGYMKNILILDVEMANIHNAVEATGQYGSHPDDSFDPEALPYVGLITLTNIVGANITVAGILDGMQESPFTAICFSNISLSMNTNNSSSTYWVYSYVYGYY